MYVYEWNSRVHPIEGFRKHSFGAALCDNDIESGRYFLLILFWEHSKEWRMQDFSYWELDPLSCQVRMTLTLNDKILPRNGCTNPLRGISQPFIWQCFCWQLHRNQGGVRASTTILCYRYLYNKKEVPGKPLFQLNYPLMFGTCLETDVSNTWVRFTGGNVAKMRHEIPGQLA